MHDLRFIPWASSLPEQVHKDTYLLRRDCSVSSGARTPPYRSVHRAQPAVEPREAQKDRFQPSRSNLWGHNNLINDNK